MAAKPAQPERAVARACIAWLRLVLPVGSITATIVNEQRGTGATAVQRARYGQARKASGVVSGFFDATSLLPSSQSIWYEWKRPGGIISDYQVGVHDRARALGHLVVIADGIESCRAALLAAGVPLREVAGQAVAAPRVRVAKAKARMPADAVPF